MEHPEDRLRFPDLPYLQSRDPGDKMCADLGGASPYQGFKVEN